MSSSRQLAAGDVVGQYVISERIGQGTFSDIYLAAPPGDSDARVAVKVERPNNRPVLPWEAGILLKMQRYACVPRHYGLVDLSRGTKALLMQVLGDNVSQLRKAQPNGLLPLGAALAIGGQMLTCLEALHREGYVHRDVKPSNFCMGGGPELGVASVSLPPASATRSVALPRRLVYLLDFGEARMFVDDKGK